MAKITTTINKAVSNVDFGQASPGITPGLAQARALDQLGQGVGALSQGVARYLERRDALDESTKRQDFENKANMARQNAENLALSSPNLKPDGSNLVQTMEGAFEKERSSFFKDLSQDDKDRAGVIWDAYKLKNRDQLFNQQRIKHAEFTVRESERITKDRSLNVFNDPNSFAQQQLMMTDHFNALQNSTMIDQAQRDKLVQSATEDMGIQAIQGMIRKREYDQAAERLLKGDVSTVFDSEKRQKLLDLIDIKKVQSFDSDLKEAAIKKSQDKEQRELKQREEFGQLVGSVAASKTPDDLIQVEQEADRLLATGRLDKEDNRFVKQMIRGDLKIDDGQIRFRITDTITEGATDPKVIREQIKRAVNTNQLNPSSGSTLLQQLNNAERSDKVDKTRRSRLKLGSDRLKAVFGSPGFMDIGIDLEKRKRASDAQIRFEELTNIGNPEALEPIDAAERVINELGTPNEKAPVIPGFSAIDQIDSVSVLKLAPQVESAYRSGSITKDEYDRRRKSIINRAKILREQEAQFAKPKGANQ